MKSVKNFLDGEGRLKAWPAKQTMQREALAYIAAKFETGRVYSESEVNQTIGLWHTFNDLFIIRRGMADAGLLKRKSDGSAYWREETETQDDKNGLQGS